MVPSVRTTCYNYSKIMTSPLNPKALRDAVVNFRKDAKEKYTTTEECRFAQMIAATAERLQVALENKCHEQAKLEVFTFRRQMSDTYSDIISSLKRVSDEVANINRGLRD